MISPADELRVLRRRVVRTLAGAALLLNALLARWVYADNPLAAEVSAGLAALILALPILWRALREASGRRSIQELVAIGVLAAFAQGDLFSAAAVALFLQLGQLIETRSAVGARAAVEAVMRLAPRTAARLSDGAEVEVALTELRPGDRIRIRAGENVPADGRVRSGASTLDQATVTGESLPVDKRVGDEVYAGTSNLTGVLEVEVTRVGEETTLGRVRRLILEAERSRLPVQRLIDRYAGIYTPVVLMLAGLVWFFTHDFTRVVAMLVVAVQESFLLAVPTAVVAALSAAARLGVLVKSAAHLETMARADAFLFDKTGTLTTGELEVAGLQPLGEATRAELLRLAASAEQGSRHPVAAALGRLAGEHRVPLVAPVDFAETAGRGVSARVNGSLVRAGTAEWMLEAGVDPERFAVPPATRAEGVSLVYCLADGAPLGWFELRDKVRPEAAEALAALRDERVALTAMVTGDRDEVAGRVAAELGIGERRARQLPEEKTAYVEAVRARGLTVVMVGDGVNDGAALAAADLGIAIGAGGNDIALNSAAVALQSADLRLVPFLLRLARRTRTVVNQNLGLALAAVVIGLVASGAGWLTPALAALLRPLDELLVVFNSARLVRAGESLGEAIHG